jgi:hypothetical protein
MWGWLPEQRPPRAGAVCDAPPSRISAKRFALPVGSGVRLRAVALLGRCVPTTRVRPSGRVPAVRQRSIQVGRARPWTLSAAGSSAYRSQTLLPSSTPRSRCCLGGKGQPPTGIAWSGLGAPTRRSRDHSKEGSSAARGVFMPSARPSSRSIPPRTIALWGVGSLHEPIARSHEGGVVGHALGAKRVALGPLSRGRSRLGRGAPRDGVGVPAPGFATFDLHADSWRRRCTHPGPQVGARAARGPHSCHDSVGCCAARQ